MTDLDMTGTAGRPQTGQIRPSSWFARLVASPSFQAWAAHFPLTRRIVRREGEAMFDLVAGFCHSQILQTLVKLHIPQMLLDTEMTAEALASATQIPFERMQILLAGATSLNLLKQRRSGHYALTTRGAALAGVPGLSDMIAHHDVLYRDLADPVAFFRGEVQTELADFWPYVFGAKGATDPQVTATYSQLMSDSQTLVAADTLDAISFKNITHLLDIGGGTGAFLGAVGAKYPDLSLTLFDLPAVVEAANERFNRLGIAARTHIVPGSFRDDPLPVGSDMISLVRVLYDHADDTVQAFLAAAYTALPAGGRILISEPMTGGARPERAGDAYFALYCMAMRTGHARSAQQICQLLEQAGFANITAPRSARAFITSVLTAVKPS